MAGQPTVWSGYWAAATLAGIMPRPIQASAAISASTTPLDLAGFQVLIDQVSAEFDQAAAKAGYIVPIPSTASGYLVAQSAVRRGAIARALETIYTGPDPKFIDRFQAAFDAALKAIEQGDRPLPGAPQDPGTTGRVMPIWSGVASPVMTATLGYPGDLQIPTDF